MSGRPVLLKLWSKISGAEEFAEASLGMMKQISAVHARVHEGVIFNCSEIVNSVAAGGRLSYLIQVGSYDAHLRMYNFTSTVGPAPTELYEAPFSDAASLGVVLPVVNLNRLSGNAATAAVNRDPFIDVNSLGTLLDTNLIEATAGGSIKAAGGESGAPVIEWELNKNTEYLSTFVNSGSSVAIVEAKHVWYEDGR